MRTNDSFLRGTTMWVCLLATLLIMFGAGYAQVPVVEEWAVQVDITGAPSPRVLKFGTKNNHTDGFDAGSLDVVAPPRSQSFEAIFQLLSGPTATRRLTSDFRGPATTPNNWRLVLENVEDLNGNPLTITLSWAFTDAFPLGDNLGVLTMSHTQIGAINMLTQNSVTVTGEGVDIVLMIHFDAPTINLPIADFSGAPLFGQSPLQVTFTQAVSNTSFIDNFEWSFPGGTPPSAAGSGPHTVVYNAPGLYDVTLIATNLAGSDTATKASYIHVGVPKIYVNPTPLIFGYVAAGSSKSQTLVIGNDVSATLDLVISSITSPAGTNFSVSGVPVLPFTLAPGASQMINVTFAPENVGSQSGNLVIGSNDPDENTLAVPLSGLGVSWFMPVTVSPIGSEPLPPAVQLAVGGYPTATNGFDSVLDIVAAPPGQTYYAYFSIAPPVRYLSTDIRGWQAPFETDIDWTLPIVNAGDLASDVCWDSNALPDEGTFTLKGGGLNVNMRTQSCARVTGDATLTIQYRREICVRYNFTIAGGAWYLISLPVIPADRTVQSLFPGATAVFGWDYQNQSYSFATELEPQRAYWLLMLQAQTVEVCGLPLDSYTKNYTAPGWDLVGSAVEPGPIVDTPNGSVIAMFGWNATTQSYVSIESRQADTLKGYWILVLNTPSSISVGSGSAASFAASGAYQAPPAFYQKYGALPPPPPTALAQEPKSTLPENYGLLQNYPNPFNPETVIEYQLPEAGRVSLKIYDMMGREVRNLVEGEKPGGYHRVIWNGKDESGQRLNSGVFLYRLQAGGFVQTKKIILLK